MSWIELPLFVGLAVIVLSLTAVYLKGDSPSLVARVEPKSVQHGGQLRLTVSLTNLGDKPIKLTFPSSLTFDFEVSGENGYYRWSQGKYFLEIMTIIELKPGEEKTVTFTWVADLPPGEYQVKAFMEPMSGAKLQSDVISITIV